MNCLGGFERSNDIRASVVSFEPLDLGDGLSGIIIVVIDNLLAIYRQKVLVRAKAQDSKPRTDRKTFQEKLQGLFCDSYTAFTFHRRAPVEQEDENKVFAQ